MVEKRYDLVVLGAGNAGLAAAAAARKAGWSVAIVEPDLLGGTCPNRGCVPKKVLVAAAEALDVIRRARQHGIAVATPSLDWSVMMARKRDIIEPIPVGNASSLERRGIDLVRGRAVFVGRDAVQVGDTCLRAPKFVVATGSRPRTLPIEGAHHAITSAEFLSLPAPPSSAVFIGAGVIAMEFSHVLARMGCRATVLARSRALRAFDEHAVAAVVEHSRAVGIELIEGAAATAIVATGERFTVHATVSGQVRTFEADAVVNAAGRVANVDNLDIENAGITIERGRVAVDAFLRSVDNPDVYVAGDAIAGAPQLSPVATKEGRLVGHNLLADELRAIDYRTVPSAVFTIPTLARVGLTEARARAQGLSFDVVNTDLRPWISSRTYLEDAGFAKVVVESGTGAILGADLFGHGAGDTIHIFAMAMAHGIPADDIRAMDYAYPTHTSDVKYLI